MKTKSFYKFTSILLALTLMLSCFSITAIAVEAEEETKIYFETPTVKSWGTTKNAYCHMYNVYGGTPLKETAWQSSIEKCTFDEETGLYCFDTSKLGTIEEGADYALLFSTLDTDRRAHQTCIVTFGKDCLGDTVYVTDAYEFTQDGDRNYLTKWKNNSDKYGYKAEITASGKITGEYFPVYKPIEAVVAENIHNWAVLNSTLYTKEVVQNICTQVGADNKAVYDYYSETYASELAEPEKYPFTASLETIAELLDVEVVTYFVAGSQELCGSNWGCTDLSNKMIEVDGIYTKTFYNVQPAKRFALKVVETRIDSTQIWHGDEYGNNILFNITKECDVTVTFNPETKKIEVLGDGVEMITGLEIEAMRTVGNGDGSWLNGVTWDPVADENLMHEVTDNVYEIKYQEVEEFDNYQLKFAANDSWADNWGGTFEGFGVVSDAVYNSSGNITFSVPDSCSELTITIDLTEFNYNTKQGAKFCIDIAYYTHDYETYGDVNADGTVNILDATAIGKYLTDIVSFDEYQLAMADFNGDGIINISDSTDIQKMLANIDYSYNH